MGTSGESCEHHNEPLGSKEAGNFSNSWAIISFSRKIMLYGISCLLFYKFVKSIYTDYTSVTKRPRFFENPTANK
jgi:hypothetical protein